MLELLGAVQFKKECTSGHDFFEHFEQLGTEEKGRSYLAQKTVVVYKLKFKTQ